MSNIGGNHITGFFMDKTTKVYDYFCIGSSYWDEASAKRVIDEIKEVTDLFYH